MPVEPHPSATVVLVCEREGQWQALLVRRSSRLAFHGGAWVFPGGRVDASDWVGLNSGDVRDAARRAAVREVAEETRVALGESGLRPLSRWTTPPEFPKRFLTWFFLAKVADCRVRVDGAEVVDHQWLSPASALAARARGRIELPAPTFVTLTELARPGVIDARLRARDADFERFVPRPLAVPGGVVSLYEGDHAYAGGDVDHDGPRHRLWMLESAWRYERHGC